MSRPRRDESTAAEVFALVGLLLAALLVLLVGPSQRFLVLLIPFALLLCGSGLARLLVATPARVRPVAYVLFAGVLAGQALLSVRTLHASGPLAVPSWSVSALRYDVAPWGYNDLELYLEELLDHASPAVVLSLPPRLSFIEAIRARHPRQSGGQPRARLIVYDPRINNVAKVWLYDRRYFYDGWPILSVDDYEEAKRLHPGFFAQIGIDEFYYIAAADDLFTAGNTSTSPRAAEVARRLSNRAPVRQLVGPDGRRTFTVYRSEEEF